MKFATVFAVTIMALGANAHHIPSSWARTKRGTQFITGPCTSDSDCAENCCSFNKGTCAAPVFAQEADSGDGGCGFGDAAPNCNAAAALGSTACITGADNAETAPPPAAAPPAAVAPPAAAPPPPAPASTAPPATGTQFITGPCTSDSDCAEACCSFNKGTCAAPVFAQEAASGDGGCGFGNPTPNCNAAAALGSTQCA